MATTPEGVHDGVLEVGDPSSGVDTGNERKDDTPAEDVGGRGSGEVVKEGRSEGGSGDSKEETGDSVQIEVGKYFFSDYK